MHLPRLQGTHGKQTPDTFGLIPSGQKNSRKLPGCAIALAVFAALHPGISQAAEEAFPEPQPVSRPIEPAAPTAVQMSGGQLVPAESHSADEPTPPGEGPSNDIDAVTIGGGSGVDSFWKPEIHVGVTTGVVFDDNIFITNTNTKSDTIFVVSARATLAFGNVDAWAARFIDTTERAIDANDERSSDNLLAVSYAPTANFFSKNSGLDNVEHDVAGTARWSFGKLDAAFDGRLQKLSNPDEDLGQRADRIVTTANLVLTYNYSDKLRLQAEGGFFNRNYKSSRDSTQIEGTGYFLYDITPKVTVGFGLGGGQLDLGGGETQDFERALARFNYNSYSKLEFRFAAGAEWRQTDSQGDSVNGIFSASAVYSPSDNTQITLSAFQRIEPSSNINVQNIKRTGFSLSLNQRLFQKLSFGSTLTYSNVDYSSLDNSLNRARKDDLLSINTALTLEVTQYGLLRVGYLYQQNDSSRNSISYDDNQFIVSATVLY